MSIRRIPRHADPTTGRGVAETHGAISVDRYISGMPPVAMRAFKTALEQGTPDAVYLLHGDNEFLKTEKVRELVDCLADAATRDFNVEQLRATEIDSARLSAALDGLPLMASRRVVVLHDIGSLKKDSRAALDRYLTHLAPDTVLVLVAASGWKVDAALLAQTSSVDVRQFTEDETIRWTLARASRVVTTIDEDAARLLVRATGADLALIDGELRKLRDYSEGRPITSAAVHAIVGVRAGETMSDLLDAMCARDGVRAASLVELVLSQPKTTGVSLVMALTTHMLGIGQVLVSHRNRTPPRQLSGDLYAMLGEARSSMVGRPWGEAVSAWMKHADRWDDLSVARALALLRKVDGSMKESSLSSDEQTLATLLLTMCHQRRSPVA